MGDPGRGPRPRSDDVRAAPRASTARRRRVLDLARTVGRAAPDPRRAATGPRPAARRAMVDAIGEAAREPEAVLRPPGRADVASVTVHDAGYPGRLRRIEEPPPVLFVRGPSARSTAAHAVAVVGTRRPTEAGRRIAARIADGAGRRSARSSCPGLAVGIDGAAHAAAVATERPDGRRPRLRPRPPLPAGPPAAGGGDRRHAAARSLASWPPTPARRTARSRGATG